MTHQYRIPRPHDELAYSVFGVPQEAVLSLTMYREGGTNEMITATFVGGDMLRIATPRWKEKPKSIAIGIEFKPDFSHEPMLQRSDVIYLGTESEVKEGETISFRLPKYT